MSDRIDPRLYDGCIVRLPSYITATRGRVVIPANNDGVPFSVAGAWYTMVRLPDPNAELILIPTRDLEYMPMHDCPSCGCNYPPSSKTFKSSHESIKFS